MGGSDADPGVGAIEWVLHPTAVARKTAYGAAARKVATEERASESRRRVRRWREAGSCGGREAEGQPVTSVAEVKALRRPQCPFI